MAEDASGDDDATNVTDYLISGLDSGRFPYELWQYALECNSAAISIYDFISSS